MFSTWHEPVCHAAQGCQAATLSLTALSGVVFCGHATLKAKKEQGFWLVEKSCHLIRGI
jgi:hypothetical protein